MRTFVFLALFVTYLSTQAQSPAPPAAEAAPKPCGGLGASYTRTTLYFGLTRPMGTVTESQWRAFLRDQVTPRFPSGFTVWEANGQWRQANGHIVQERSKVLLVMHEETSAVRPALTALVTEYKRRFDQESVLWETAPVCAAF